MAAGSTARLSSFLLAIPGRILQHLPMKKILVACLSLSLVACAPSYSQQYGNPEYRIVSNTDKFTGNKTIALTGNSVEWLNDGSVFSDPYQYLVMMNPIKLIRPNGSYGYGLTMSVIDHEPWFPRYENSLLLLVDGKTSTLSLNTDDLPYSQTSILFRLSATYPISEQLLKEISEASSVSFRWIGTNTYHTNDLSKSALNNIKRFYYEVSRIN